MVAVKHAAGFTPTGLCDALMRVTTAEVSSEAKARIKVILDGLCNLPLTDGGKLLSEAVKVAKDTPTAGTVKQRASEARQVFGAVKYKPELRTVLEDAGWFNAVSQARDVLKSAGIKWNMAKIVSPEERAQHALAAEADSIIKAEILAADGDDQRTVGQLAEQAKAKAQASLTAERIAKHADRIMKSEGEEYGLALADALMSWKPQTE